MQKQKPTSNTGVSQTEEKVKTAGYAPTPHKFFVKNLTKNFFSQKHFMLLYQSF